MGKQWKKEQVWPFFGCCTADSQTDAGRNQLYNNDSLVLFSTAPLLMGNEKVDCAVKELSKSVGVISPFTEIGP